MAKKATKTKPLHLQKQKELPKSDSFGPKQSSDAWYLPSEQSSEQHADDNNEADDDWFYLKKQLINFHDTTNQITLKSLVEFWNDSSRSGKNSLLGGGGATLPFKFANRLFGMARVALEMSDFHATKVMILAAGLLIQSKVTGKDGIVKCVVGDGDNEADVGDDLAERLPFCHDSYVATKTPMTMKAYLDELDIENFKTRAEAAEPLLQIVLLMPERKVIRMSSLLSLNTLLSKYGETTNFSTVRVKHNGERLFLSSSGKKSLAYLGFVDNDTIEIQDVNADASFNVENKDPQGGPEKPAAAQKCMHRRKGKKKGKGKR